MKVIVPAAGVGTRLRPHTYARPKALLHVAGRTIISHILDEVRKLDVTGVVLVVGHKGELLKEYVSQEYPDLNVEYVFQKETRGIGHAVYLTRELANTDEPLLIILGDTILRTDLAAFAASAGNALGVKKVDDPKHFGVVEIKNGDVVRLVEKPKKPRSNLAMVGLYYLEESELLFDTLQKQIDGDVRSFGEYQITDALQMMVEGGARFTAFEIDKWFDCGKPDSLLNTNRQLLEGLNESPDTEDSIVIPPVSIAPSAAISHSIIGPYVSIAAESRVTNSIIRDTVIDRGADVSNCLLEGSIIGLGAVVRGGVRKLNIGDSSEVVFK